MQTPLMYGRRQLYKRRYLLFQTCSVDELVSPTIEGTRLVVVHRELSCQYKIYQKMIIDIMIGKHQIITRLQPASRWREALEIHEILNRNNYFINKWTHEIQVIQSSITCDDVRPIKKCGLRPKKFKKSVQKRSKKRSKKGPILFLKAKK